MSTVSPAALKVASILRSKINQKAELMLSSHFAGDYRSGGAKWSGGLAGDGQSLNLNHSRLRRNARSACHQYPFSQAIVERYVESVAGIGLKCESSPGFELLGISRDKAESWGSEVDKRFDLWMRSKECHRSETLTGYQAQKLYVTGQQRDGENFIRFYYSDDREALSPLSFQFIDPDQIVGSAWTSSVGGNLISDNGITLDSRGRETGYRVRIKVDKTIKTVPVPAKTSSGRPLMIHGYSPEYAGQSRGYSRLGHILQELSNLTEFSLAQIKKAINQSLFFMFVKPSAHAPATNPGLLLGQKRPMGVLADFGANPTPSDDANNVTPASLNPVTSYDMPESNVSEPGGMAVFGLNSGEDLKPFVNTAPSESYDKFVDSFSAYLSASTGTPHEIVLMRFNRNYTAARGSLVMFWRNVVMWRMEMESDFLNPLRAAWLAEEIAVGRVQAPGWSDPVLRAAWLSSQWHGAPIPDIDPLKTAKADRMDVELGAKNLDRVARERGGDGSRNRSKLKKEISELTPLPDPNQNGA